MKNVLILGITGQDGSYLAERLVAGGHVVHGLVRRASGDNLGRIQHIIKDLTLHPGDLLDGGCIDHLVNTVLPDEIYNLADQDHIGHSFATPELSVAVTAGAVGRLLETVRKLSNDYRIKVFQPVSATLFGDAPPPQDENTPLNPLSPYACAKAHAYHLCRYYRQVYGLWVATGIMYNHDSPRRGGDYLLQKICRQAVEVHRGLRLKIELNGPDTVVDIGYAASYMAAAEAILELDQPDDFIVATGRGTSIRQFAHCALSQLGLKTEDHLLFKESDRPGPSPQLIGCPHKIRRLTGWRDTLEMSVLVTMILDHYQALV